VNVNQFVQVTAGKVGCSVKQPDGTSALYVVAYAGDTFQFLSAGGAVLLDAFPPEVDGAHQIVKSFSANVGVVRFSDAELATIPTAQITVTVLAQRGVAGFPRVLLGPVTFTGLDKTVGAEPAGDRGAARPRCAGRPEPRRALRPDRRLGELADLHRQRLHSRRPARHARVRPHRSDGRPGDGRQNLLNLPMNQLQCFSVTETVTIGVTNLFASPRASRSPRRTRRPAAEA